MTSHARQEPKSGNILYADLAIPLALDRVLTYAVPAALRERAQVGMRAVAPLRNRVETGYIVGLRHQCDLAEVRPLLDFPDEGPVFSQAMLDLCRWMSEYYCCSWGEALHCAAPAGMRAAAAMSYRLQPEQVSAGRFSERQRRVIAELYRRGPLTSRQLAAAAGRTALSNTLRALVRRGVVVEEQTSHDSGASIRTETWAQLREDTVLPADALLALQRKAPKQAMVYLDLLHGAPERAATELYARHHVTPEVLRALERKELIALSAREFYRRPDFAADSRAALKHALNVEQQAAYDTVSDAMAAKRFQTFLLHGITGSGKTEVYLQIIEHALALGRDAIMLVPEISLTPQTVGRFFARFQQRIAVLHSGLSAGERFDEWRRAQRGEVRIVVGARSAIFAPLPRVGVIVVDEEHDHSYKQNETPRYHARDVAVMRAKMAGAVCVLGSATPSIESACNAEKKKYARLNLLSRATSGALPEVRLVDMRQENKECAGQVILSRALEQAVQQRVDAKEQAILLLNRRGFAPFVMCPMCGWVAPCENCQVSLTYHSAGGVLRCHYCGAQRGRPVCCDQCRFDTLIYLGTGTQKAEDYLMRSFPNARIERMDADTTAGKGGHAKILGRFAQGEIDILIGTQMLAKGHDYPGVTLVGVINADTSLSVPDFRAAEQTFQLLTQVAGRAGRGDRPGEVIIQTYRPRHYAIQAAAQHDYAAFYAQEMEHRRSAKYPPYRRMAGFAIESEDPQVAERHAVLLRRLLREQRERLDCLAVDLLGPAPAAIRRVKRKYRWNMAALGAGTGQLNALVRAVRAAFDEQCGGADVQLKVDLDPYAFY